MAGGEGGSTVDGTDAENVLILGLRRSGKSSIVEVVYKSLSPDDSLFLESTLKCHPLLANTFQSVKVWDGTGNVDRHAASQRHDSQQNGAGPSSQAGHGDARGQPAWCTGGQLYWTHCAAVIFVIDSQDDIYDAIDRLNDVIIDAYAFNPLIHFHVFVHKVDGHSVDYRYDTLHTIQTRVADNLADASASFIFAPTAHQILASERQNLSPSLALDGQGQQAGPESAIEDVRTGLDGASSSLSASGLRAFSTSNPDLERDVRLTFHTTSIYNSSIYVAFSRVQIGLMNDDVAKTLEALCNGLSNSCKFEKVYLFDIPTKTYIAADSSPFDENNFEAISEYLSFLVQFSGLYSTLGKDESKSSGDDSSEVRYSASIARLSPDTTLGIHQINHHLALAFAVRTDIHTKHAGMIDFNVAVARKSIMDVYDVCHA